MVDVRVSYRANGDISERLAAAGLGAGRFVRAESRSGGRVSLLFETQTEAQAYMIAGALAVALLREGLTVAPHGDVLLLRDHRDAEGDPQVGVGLLSIVSESGRPE